MAKLIKSMRQKVDGEYGAPIPFGANAENVSMANNVSVQDTIGIINVADDGDIATQLANRYTKSETDELINAVDDKFANYYTSEQVDNKFSNYYTKTQITNTLGNYYTKTQVQNYQDGRWITVAAANWND